MSDEYPPEQELEGEGINVFFEPPRYRPKDIEAELPDGTRVPSKLLSGGRRLGFDRSLPRGAWILRRGVRTWGPVGIEPERRTRTD